MHRRSLMALPPLLAVAFAIPLAHAQPLPAAKPEEVGLDPARLARIGQLLSAEVDAGRLPGGVIMVARRGKLVHTEAVGFRDKATRATLAPDAVFRIYSMTKPLVSVAAMILVEEGKLQLTDPVSRHLPGFDRMVVSEPRIDPLTASVSYVQVPAARPMTVQDLLRHTSGLAYGEITQNAQVRTAYTQGGVFRGTDPFDARQLTPQQFTAAVAAAPLAKQPGTTWEYSLSSDVLGRVVEAASGQRLEVFLEERLFKPLGMADTAFFVPEPKAGRLAQGLGVDPAANNTPVGLIDVSRAPGNASGGAGAVSTAADYLRFTQMMANGGSLGGVRILSPATVRLMTSDHLGSGIAQPVQPGELLLGTRGYGFGLGFAVRLADGVAGVPGQQGQFMWAGYGGTYFWADPKEELAVVFMSAAPSVGRAAYRRLMMQMVYAAITG
ncbi:serine hydrolase [Elioraea sp.]|uniref:serine hydrolase domain-containing protein n=1 Tax=Elioraea sp. TaxID=2185103 RepID=UPI0025BF39F4|nr:serine hydrolase domain-containing protein [Elioraea sp.]